MSAKRIVPDSGPQAFGLSGIHAGIYGISCLGLALLCACGGSIDTTDEDDRRADLAEARGGGALTAPPASPSGNTPDDSGPALSRTSPGSNPPPATPQAVTPPATPPASTPPASTPPASAPPAGSATLSFETDVWPIFNSSCGPCHVSIGLGNQNIGAPDKDAALQDAISFKAAIVSEIEGGDMPPGCSAPPGSAGCVSEANFDLIKSWVDDGTPP